MDRRTFLFNSAAAALGAASAPALAQGASPRLPIRKAVEFTMLPKSLSPLERMRLAKECGFEAVEIGTQEDPRIAEEYKKASDQAGLPIHSVMNMAHWEFPLSSPKPEVVARSRARNPGSTTLMTGTVRPSSPADAAVLQATTTILTPCSSTSLSVIWRENRRTSSRGRGPYG